MAFLVGGTTVFNNSAVISASQVTAPAGAVYGVSVSVVGDNENPLGTGAVRCTSASFSGGTIYLQFNTNCAGPANCACGG